MRIVDIDGQLKVDSFLQVSGYDNIYAIGDCNTCPEKLAYAAVEQAKLLISNLKRKHAGYEMLPWKPGIFLLTILYSKVQYLVIISKRNNCKFVQIYFMDIL